MLLENGPRGFRKSSRDRDPDLPSPRVIDCADGLTCHDQCHVDNWPLRLCWNLQPTWC